MVFPQFFITLIVIWMSAFARLVGITLIAMWPARSLFDNFFFAPDNKDRVPRLVKLEIGSLPIAYPTVTRNVTSTMVVAISIKINIKVFLPVEAD